MEQSARQRVECLGAVQCDKTNLTPGLRNNVLVFSIGCAGVACDIKKKAPRVDRDVRLMGVVKEWGKKENLHRTNVVLNGLARETRAEAVKGLRRADFVMKCDIVVEKKVYKVCSFGATLFQSHAGNQARQPPFKRRFTLTYKVYVVCIKFSDTLAANYKHKTSMIVHTFFFNRH